MFVGVSLFNATVLTLFLPILLQYPHRFSQSSIFLNHILQNRTFRDHTFRARTFQARSFQLLIKKIITAKNILIFLNTFVASLIVFTLVVGAKITPASTITSGPRYSPIATPHYSPQNNQTLISSIPKIEAVEGVEERGVGLVEAVESVETAQQKSVWLPLSDLDHDSESVYIIKTSTTTKGYSTRFLKSITVLKDLVGTERIVVSVKTDSSTRQSTVRFYNLDTGNTIKALAIGLDEWSERYSALELADSALVNEVDTQYLRH